MKKTVNMNNVVYNMHKILNSRKNKKAFCHMMEYSERRPLDINIETTTICPMKCKFCCNRIYNREKNVMSMEMFESIVKEYVEDVGGGTLGIGSMQSDFLVDPLLLDRMNTIKKYKDNLWVHSTTPFISAAKYSDEELKNILTNLDFLVISVEGYNRETYKELCGVDGFETLMTQLRRLKRIIKENELSIDVAMAFRTYDRHGLISSDTYNELVRMFRDGGIIDNFFSWFGSVKQEDLPTGATINYSDNSTKREDCVVPHATLAIQTNGNVVACGCIDWLEQYIIGNIRDNSLLEIWTSELAKEFRKAFSSGKTKPHICEECGLYSSVNKCFHRKELVDYDSKDGLYYWVK